jgi:hypothetical protein
MAGVTRGLFEQVCQHPPQVDLADLVGADA